MGNKERQEREREAMRRAILDAARELFVKEGYRNVSVRKIAERIEYSGAAIYSYFPSKDAQSAPKPPEPEAVAVQVVKAATADIESALEIFRQPGSAEPGRGHREDSRTSRTGRRTAGRPDVSGKHDRVGPAPAGRGPTSNVIAKTIGGMTSRGADSDAAGAGQAAPLALTIDSALQIAMDQNEGLKVNRERVSEMQSRVGEAKAAFLPALNLNFLYTPAQRFPTIRIPAGIFGPNELTFSAAFTRQNILRVDLTQPIYAGGRLQTGQRISSNQLREAEFELEQARQALRLQVVQAFCAALMGEQGMKVADEGVRLAENHLALAKVRFDPGTAARLDVLRGEVELARARASLIQACRVAASVRRSPLTAHRKGR